MAVVDLTVWGHVGHSQCGAGFGFRHVLACAGDPPGCVLDMVEVACRLRRRACGGRCCCSSSLDLTPGCPLRAGSASEPIRPSNGFSIESTR
eukprot:3406753-Pyramimonas_sp.AAC.1